MFRACIVALACLAVLGVARAAEATTMTYVFAMPAFTGGGFMGQTSVLEVTVDNGHMSAANQSYYSFGIDAFAVTVGTQMVSLGLDPADGASYFGDLLYITTDARGIPTLDLTTTRPSQVSFSNRAGDRIGLSTGNYLSFPTYRVVIDHVEGTLQSDLQITGRPATTVPEAPSLALFVLGLAALILAYHRMNGWAALRIPGGPATQVPQR